MLGDADYHHDNHDGQMVSDNQVKWLSRHLALKRISPRVNSPFEGDAPEGTK